MLILGDARNIPLRDGCVQTCVTSPPYFGLRDYKVKGQIGLEESPEQFVAGMAGVFREVWRILRDDGTLWLNLGDSYATVPGKGNNVPQTKWKSNTYPEGAAHRSLDIGLEPKNLIGIPWRVAFALQADGWYLRSDIIWSKPNPMTESVRDRPTKSHEYIFLLTKQPRYYYDYDAVKEADSGQDHKRTPSGNEPSLEPSGGIAGPHTGLRTVDGRNGQGRNRRTVWTVTTQPYAGAHFATFPPDLIKPCILAGAPNGGIVFDPFVGSGTTVKVATELGRIGIGMDCNKEYLHKQAKRRSITTIGLPF